MYFDDDVVLASAKRTLAPLGEYTTLWPSSTDLELAGLVADGFGEARLNGYFPNHTYSMTLQSVEPDLNDAELALVLAYASARAIRTKLLSLSQAQRYKAGSVETETTPIATVLTSLLKSAEDIIDISRRRSNHSLPLFADMTTVGLLREYLNGQS